MSKPTKKILGGKKPSKTRKNRKPLKKNKRKNIKKGGLFGLGEKPPSDKFTSESIKNFFDHLQLYGNKHDFMTKDGAIDVEGGIEEIYKGINFTLIKKTDMSEIYLSEDDLSVKEEDKYKRINVAFNKIYKKIEEIENDKNIPKERIIIQTPKKNCSNWNDVFCKKSITKKTLINAAKKLKLLYSI
jgi:hypothetical protein